jgi:ribosome maturation protein SDO1
MNLDKAIIGRIKKGGETFEVYLDPDKAYDYINGKKKDLKNILVVEEVFKDAKKGERQSPAKIKEVFGTDDIYVVLKEILEKGEVQLTTEQRRKMQEEKRKQIIHYISRNAIDVRTNAPVPEQRVELAMEEAKIRVDPFKPVDAQVPEIMKALKRIIPIKFATARIAVKIPAEYAMKAYSILKNYGMKQEEWGSQGELYAVVEIPAGMQGEFLDKLNKATAGNVMSKLLGIKE